MLQIKGISELLEGLIPYSQRHFSRIDRLIRSTFLLDYTLLRMSVIEPATQDDLKTKSLLHSEKNMDNAEEDQKQVSEEQKPKASGKKRKSHKSGERSRSHKKVKDSSSHANTPAVPLQAWWDVSWCSLFSWFACMLADLLRSFTVQFCFRRKCIFKPHWRTILKHPWKVDTLGGLQSLVVWGIAVCLLFNLRLVYRYLYISNPFFIIEFMIFFSQHF